MSSTVAGATLRSVLGGKLLVLGLGEVASRVFTFLAMAYLFRVLGRENFGHLETALAILMFATLAVDQGLSVLGAREVARDSARVPQLVERIVSTQWVLSFLVVGMLVAGALLVPMETALRRLLLGLSLSLFAVPFFLHWVFQGRNQMFWFALPRALRYGVFLVLAWMLVQESSHVVRLSLAELAAVGVMGLAYVVVLRRSDPVKVRWRIDRPLLREAMPIGGSNLVWVLRMYLSIVLIKVLAGPAAVAIFAAAQRILMVYQGGLDVYFTKLFPTMSQASARSSRELRGLLHRSLHLLTWPTLLMAGAVTYAAPEIMQVVYGKEHTGQDAAQLLVLLIWLAPILAWRRHGRFAMISLRKQRPELYCSILGLVLLVGLLWPLTRAYGAVGAAWAMLISETAATAATWMLLLPALLRSGR